MLARKAVDFDGKTQTLLVYEPGAYCTRVGGLSLHPVGFETKGETEIQRGTRGFCLEQPGATGACAFATECPRVVRVTDRTFLHALDDPRDQGHYVQMEPLAQRLAADCGLAEPGQAVAAA